jgi:beta-galactosidase
VNVYSSCEQVELLLNGKSLGKKPTDRTTKYLASWQVPYQSGIIKAVGYNGRKQVSVSELKTSGDPAQIKLTADRLNIKSDGQDLSYVTVELTDVNGIRNTSAENPVSFSIDGPGTIVAVGNANPVSIESYQLPQRKAWRGRCLIIIKSETTEGKITLKATSQGLEPASIEITVKQQV